MFILVHYNTFEDVRERIDFEPYDIPGQNEQSTANETASASESESETEPEYQYVAIKISPHCLDDIPHGIITSKRWNAVTLCVQTGSTFPLQIPISSVIDDLPNPDQEEAIKVIELSYAERDYWLTYDAHWNCHCKTRDVCGCGCDPLHDGW